MLIRSLLLLILPFLHQISFGQEVEPFRVFNERNEETGEAVVYATNEFPCEESVFIEFTALQNMKADTTLPFKGVVPANAKKFKLFTLSIKDKTKGSQLGYIARHCHGNIYTKNLKKDIPILFLMRTESSFLWSKGIKVNFLTTLKGKNML